MRFRAKNAFLAEPVQFHGGRTVGVNVGDALREYLMAGLLLADVHLNNVGVNPNVEVDMRSHDMPIITDPGDALALKPELESVPIMVLDI